jgi:hypothetical protein
MKFWGNLLGYQAVWFVTVIGAGWGLWWPALVATATFAAWQLSISQSRRADLRLMGAALLCGLFIEGGLAAGDWAHYATPTPALPPGAPLWILSLWAAFALTLNHSLAYLRGRPWLAFAFGAIGAPLAYLSAARGWQAVMFEPPLWRGLAWLSVGWALALLLLTLQAHRWMTPRAQALSGAP